MEQWQHELNESIQSIQSAIDRITNEAANKTSMELSPFKLLNPSISIDGNQFCLLYGDNLQAGIAGFGSTVYEAVQDFNENANKHLLK